MLNRFIEAQEHIYEDVLEELSQGRKRSHWMWFIFPQIQGLGISPKAQYFAIKSKEEAIEYLAHPILGSRLIECCQKLMSIDNSTAFEILGTPDDLKLKSSMTLFATVSIEVTIFQEVLKKYFKGEKDSRTLSILSEL